MTYFPVKGRGEAIRMLCADQNIPLEEITVTGEEWPTIKKTMTFGQVPLVVLEDGTEMVQSNAILRAIARKHGLYGDSDTEANRIDMINDAQEDLRVKYTAMVYRNYEAGKSPYIQTLPSEFRGFELLLSQNNGGSGFFVGNKISWLDYIMFNNLDMHVALSPRCLDEFPLLKAFHQRIASRPAINTYLNSETAKSMPFNGNGKQ